jgi:hypothetical protein
MLPSHGEAATDAHFDPTTKCCTYQPALANFLVGGLVADTDPAIAEGRARVRERIAKRIAVTPLGVMPPSHFAHLYKPASGTFGHARSLRCPYYAQESGACTVWRHRNAVCTTWFCKHERGDTASEFWTSLASLLTEAEKAIARHCIVTLDVGEAAMKALFPNPSNEAPALKLDDLDGRVDEAAYRAAWGTWLGREEELYVASAEIAGRMRWNDLRAVGGSALAVRERVARDALAALLTGDLPERAKLGAFRIEAMARSSYRASCCRHSRASTGARSPRPARASRPSTASRSTTTWSASCSISGCSRRPEGGRSVAVGGVGGLGLVHRDAGAQAALDATANGRDGRGRELLHRGRLVHDESPWDVRLASVRQRAIHPNG